MKKRNEDIMNLAMPDESLSENKSTPVHTVWKRHMAIVSIFLLASTGWSQLARGAPQQDLLFFLSAEGYENLSSSVAGIEDSFLRPSADILYTTNSDKFRFLGEYFLSSKESELERLQAGWQVGDQAMVWLGRFHNISNFWSTEFHHGQFMQTSISRPGLAKWEDDGGPTVSHITGLLLEYEYARSDESALAFEFAAGLGPKLISQEMQPFDLLDPQSGHDLSLSYRMAYRPDVLSTSQIGLTMGWNEIQVESASNPNLANLRDIQQLTISLFADWRWANYRLITDWTYFNNKLRPVNSAVTDEFVLGYLQVEYQASRDWTLFGRGETGFGEDNSPFLSLLPPYAVDRYMLGVRWDLADTHSLALEIADVSTQGSNSTRNNFKELRVQWSTVIQ